MDKKIVSKVTFTIPEGCRISALMIGGIWLHVSPASPPPALGSGSITNRYAKEEVEISLEERQKVNDFVTQKLIEIAKKPHRHCGYCNKKVIAPCTSQWRADNCLNKM